jgi:hypothetical protein
MRLQLRLGLGFLRRGAAAPPPEPPAITTTELDPATEGTAYSFQLAATGTVTAWTLEDGALPDGLTLSSGGLISGTPTESGTFEITVRATGPGGFDEKEFELEVAPEFSTARSDGFSNVSAGQSLDGKAWDNALGGSGSQSWQFLYGWGGAIRGATGGGLIEFLQDGDRNARSSAKLINAQKMGIRVKVRLSGSGNCSVYPRYQLSGGSGDNHHQSGFAAARLVLVQGATAKLRFYSGASGAGGNGEDSGFYRQVDLGGSNLPANEWLRVTVTLEDNVDDEETEGTNIGYRVKIINLDDDDAVIVNTTGVHNHSKALGVRLSELSGNSAYVAIRGLEGAGTALMDNFEVVTRS